MKAYLSAGKLFILFRMTALGIRGKFMSNAIRFVRLFLVIIAVSTLFPLQAFSAPLTTVSPWMGTYREAQNATLTCTDATGPGCATTYYCLGSGCTPTMTYSGPISVATSTTLRFYSEDVAGNKEPVRSYDYTIDPTLAYRFERLWPRLNQPWYFNQPRGVAVDSSGNIYVADSGNHRVQKFDSNGNYLMEWGSYGRDNGQFFYPAGASVDVAGNVYVVESGNNRIQKFDSNGNFITKWGASGSGDGQFSSPTSVAVDAAGNVYVADLVNSRIQKFDGNGNYLTKWGSLGTGAGQFKYVQGLAVDNSGNVYVADTANCRIQKFDCNGNYLTQWGTSGSNAGQFIWPQGVLVDLSGNIYVADFNRIQKFDSNGNYLTQWGTPGSANGQLNSVYGVAVDSIGNIYVADSGNDRIQKFTSGGTYVSQLGTSLGSDNGQFNNPNGVAVDLIGNIYVADYYNNRIQKFDSSGNHRASWGSSGSGSGQFTNPTGVAVDIGGNIYVADSSNHRVQKFDSSGNYVTEWGGYGNGDGQFMGARAVAVDATGNVYVVDESNNRVQKFTSSGSYLTQWGFLGSGNGQFSRPYSVAVDAIGNVYVTDLNNYRIQKFDSNGNYLNQWFITDPLSVAVDAAGNVYVADGFQIKKFTGRGTYLTQWGSSGTGNGQFSYISGVAVDASGNVYAADTENNRIQKFNLAVGVPGVPTDIFATAGNGQATVSFTAPTSSGGSPVVFYTVIASAGNITATGSVSPIIVTNLTYGTAYSFTVTATNAAGAGPVSIPSNSVTLADTTPPMTTASPSSSTYNGVQNVTLSCNDGSGSGCASTYYCLGTGCTPTTSYSSAISISNSTDLMFYSRDVAGNSEAVKTATYTIVSTYALNVSEAGTGSGTVTGPSISCTTGSTTGCSTSFTSGSTVTLTATATLGSAFAGWNGPCSAVSGNQCSAVMDADKNIAATFNNGACADPVSPSTTGQTGSSVNDLGEIVWSQSDPTGYQQIYSNVRGQLTSDTNSHMFPALNNRGDVVWEQNGQIYGLLSGQLTQLTMFNNGHQPSINDFGEVVWSQFDPTTGHTQIYSITRGYLTTDQNEHVNPSINNRGDLVWEQPDPTNGFNQIYGIVNGMPSQITNNPAWHGQPAISNSGEVVWVQSQSQWQGGPDSRIYSSTRGQVTHDCPLGWGHSEPSVNSCGDLTFTNSGSNGPAIYRLGNNAPCANDPEPNNSRQQAVAVGGNSTTTGTLDSVADMEDWYSFTANAGDAIKVNVNWTATPPNMLIAELQDNNGQVLMSIPGPVNPFVLNTVAPYTGTYYVHLMAPSGRFGYNLSVKVGTGNGACADPVSPNSTQQTGSSVNDLGEIVWSQSDPTGYQQIYSNVRGQLTSDTNQHMFPALNNRGDVVWEQNGQIYGLLSGQLTQLTMFNNGHQPSINDFGEVVWSQFDPTTGHNQIYSITRGYLTTDQNEHFNPSINSRGDLVWEQPDPTNGLNQIYGIINGMPSQITNNPAWHSQPSISNSGEVVWVQSQWQGTPDSRIYSSTRGQVTHDCPLGLGHSEPSVNSCGDLTFTNYGSNGPAIYRLGNNAPCANDPEPNNSRQQAVAVGGNSTTTGTLDSVADIEDWYSFTANAGDAIKVNVNWTATPPNMLIAELQDNNGQVLMSIPGPVNPFVLNTVAPYTGTYYVHLMAPSGRFGYNLSLNVQHSPTVGLNNVITPTNQSTQMISGNREVGTVITAAVSTSAVLGQVTYSTETTWSFTVSSLTEGDNNITITATNIAGLKGSVSATITLDTLAPTVSIVSPVAGISNKKIQQLIYSVSDGTVVVTLDGSVITSSALNNLADGPHTFIVEATDAATNKGSATVSFTIDTVPPAVAINTVVSPTNQTSQTVTGTREADAAIAVAVNTSATVGSVAYPTATTWGCSISGLAEGGNTVTVTATDAAGNKGTASASVTLDTVAPTVAISAPVAGITKNNSQLLTYTVSDGTVVVTLDGTVITGSTLDNLADGPHTLIVEATDAAGNKGSATVNFTIDTVAPAVGINPVTTPTNQISQTLTGTRETGSVITATVNTSAAFGVITYPSDTSWSVAVSNLVEGSNIITVTATDSAGNKGTAPVTITVDTLAPAVSIASPVAGISNQKSQPLTYTVSDGTVVVTLDGSIINVSSGQMLDNLSDGTHTISVQATDAAGNKGSASVSFTVDTVAPAVAINPVTSPTNQTSQTITGTREALAVITATVNTSAILGSVTYSTDTSWSITVSNLVEGNNTIAVIATDAAGNKGSSSTTITLDTVASKVSISSPVAGISNQKSQQLIYTVSDGTVVVTLDGTVITGSNLDNLANGPHTVTVGVTDAAGNKGSATVNFTIDTIAPAVGINPVTTPTNQTSQTLTGTRETGSVITATVNTSAAIGVITYPSDTTWSVAVSNLVEGSNIITVTATDSAGNKGTAPVTITVDTLAPAVSIAAPVAGITKNNSQSLIYTVSDGSVIVKVDGTIVSKVSGDTVGPLADGPHSIIVEATDAAGNKGSATVSFTVDTLPPSVSINAVTTPTKITSQTITGVMENGASVAVAVNTAATVGSVTYLSATTWSCTISNLVYGVNDITATARDAAGNLAIATTSILERTH